VLAGLGWQIQRVWSADWAHNAAAEVARVLAAVEAWLEERAAQAIPESDTPNGSEI
jgi:hypothetical protein